MSKPQPKGRGNPRAENTCQKPQSGVKGSPKQNAKDRPKSTTEEDEKRKQWEELFRDWDEDNSGTLDVSELGKLMRQGGLNPTEEQVKMAIKQVNEDGNNELCLEAFCELMSGKWKEEKPKEKDEMKKAFESFDINGDGYITKAELMDVLCKKGDSPLSEEVAEMLFREFDKNGDGVLDYQEFVQFALE